MFGYITVTKSNLGKEDIEKYRAYYCGLCHELKALYGKDGTENLSYDMVFITLLLTDLYNAKIKKGTERCLAKPLRQHEYITSIYTEYAADMQMLLSYYSALDNVMDKDEGAEIKRLSSLERYIPELESNYARQSQSLKNGLDALREEEKKGEIDAGKMSYIFGSALSELFIPIEDDFFSPFLKSLGSALGRFIYLMDAFADRKKDQKRGAYNPLLGVEKERIESLLMNAASESSDAFEALALDDNLAILRNIIYSGIWKNYDKEKSDDR